MVPAQSSRYDRLRCARTKQSDFQAREFCCATCQSRKLLERSPLACSAMSVAWERGRDVTQSHADVVAHARIRPCPLSATHIGGLPSKRPSPSEGARR